jgi:hypothetical protein
MEMIGSTAREFGRRSRRGTDGPVGVIYADQDERRDAMVARSQSLARLSGTTADG